MAFVYILLSVWISSSLQAQDIGEFYMLKKDRPGIGSANTLFEVVAGESGKFQAIVYQLDSTKSKSGVYERNEVRRVDLSSTEFYSIDKQAIPYELLNGGKRLSFKHPFRNERVEFINLPESRCAGVPQLDDKVDTKKETDQFLGEVEKKLEEQPSSPDASLPSVSPKTVGALPLPPLPFNNRDEELLKLRMQVRDEIYQQLKDDFEKVYRPHMAKFIEELDGLESDSKKRFKKREAIKKLLEKMKKDPKFQGPAGEERAARLITALTLYGEFGTEGRSVLSHHRTLPHLFWSLTTINNRAKMQRFVNMDPQVRTEKLGNFLERGRAAVSLNGNEYSAWRFQDSKSEEILRLGESAATQRAFDDIADFIGAYDAGLITTKNGEAVPPLIFYVSPYALLYKVTDGQKEMGYPLHWYVDTGSIYRSMVEVPKPSKVKMPSFWREDPSGATRYADKESVLFAEIEVWMLERKLKKWTPPQVLKLPAIVRLDQKAENKSALKSSPAGTLEENVSPFHFEGATLKRQDLKGAPEK